MTEKYGTDCFFDEDDDRWVMDAADADFRSMEKNKEFWEERLAKWNPEYLTRWKAWRESKRMNMERKLETEAMEAGRKPAPGQEQPQQQQQPQQPYPPK